MLHSSPFHIAMKDAVTEPGNVQLQKMKVTLQFEYV